MIRTLQYRVSRMLGRAITRAAATLTLFTMPPFVSVSAVIVSEDEVVCVVDQIRREPVLPGGHLKWNETPIQALEREVREETGYEIRAGALVDAFAGKEWTGEQGVVRLVYATEVTGGRLQSSPEGEAKRLSVEEFCALSTRDGEILRSYLSRQLSYSGIAAES